MREDLKNNLFQIAMTRAKANQFNLSSTLETDLRKLINESVDRMTSSDYASDSRKVEAKLNTLILIDTMTVDARERLITESLDYKSLSNVISRICPLWPFC